jgi:integrase
MAGKRKNPADSWMPPRTYRGKTRYEYRPVDGTTIKLGMLPKEGIAGETAAVKAKVWDDYAAAVDAPPRVDDLNLLIDQYHKSPQMLRLSANTQTDYHNYSKRIRRVFGHMLPHTIKPPHIREFMDALAKQGKIVTANRHHSYLSVLLGWGIERGWLDDNPAKKVRKFQETPRDRYIEDWEFEFVKNIARQGSYPYIAPMMDLAYYCRVRSIEVRNITENDIDEIGVYTRRTKRSLAEITQWSDALFNAVEEARSLFPNAPLHVKRPLFHTKNGAPVPRESFKTAWGRVMDEALEKGLKVRFTFQDIKAKGVSDHIFKVSGHRPTSSKKMLEVYNRKPNLIPSTR